MFKILFRIIALNPSFASLLLQNIKVKTGKLETRQKLTETLSMPLYFDWEMQTKKNVIFKSFKLCFWYRKEKQKICLFYTFYAKIIFSLKNISDFKFQHKDWIDQITEEFRAQHDTICCRRETFFLEILKKKMCFVSGRNALER